ncbi:P-loop containing nucleoside triphosphate hydrolase protein [Dendrothele bispora CBS 962.96]|uniref:P-loop containing nucleoside triphosphate hydrolase protein n=1 Tax=Dendrothele bispora (strain CBS 962.96) TaxID=1314807 RepID=A0A4S8MPK5_DENBC|nr:P-loop containing nucleoside triphosphate hydrolase protein [Dendrothele bispora CBS 962.96]
MPSRGRGQPSRPQPSRGQPPRPSRFNNARRPNNRPLLPTLSGPFQDKNWINETYKDVLPNIKPAHLNDAKSTANNAAITQTGSKLTLETVKGTLPEGSGPSSHTVFRTTATVRTEPPISAVGDATSEKESVQSASLALICQMQQQGILYGKPKEVSSITLSDGQTVVDVEKARTFMDFYCRSFNFSSPDIVYTENRRGWEAVIQVQGRKIGMGSGPNKKAATNQCYLDVVQYLESCDPELWKSFETKMAKGEGQSIPRLFFSVTNNLNSAIRNLCVELRGSNLYKNRPSAVAQNDSSNPGSQSRYANPYVPPNAKYLAQKSEELLASHQKYLSDPKMEKMRTTRAALPVYTRADEVMKTIHENDVSILMAATGSGKTTQVPQLILDSYIKEGKGAHCNILCTQPRRLAALSVADRVANERGESLGKSVGYQVRFESKLPENHGSVTFCTTGVFLKRLQSALSEQRNNLDDITHIVIDEVHERDVDTDLLLVVLKRVLAERKARNKPIKVVLMSATIDPTLFQNYFPDDSGRPAKVIEVPGRTFPVQRHFMEDFLPLVNSGPTKWIFQDESVIKYIVRELGVKALPPNANLGRIDPARVAADPETEVEIPYPLIAATIAHALRSSDSGHVLTFLAGWDDIIAVQKLLQAPPGSLGINFNDTSKYSIHLLHSTIPLADQQVIFSPPPPGVRRIILATNIAETSVTIPDVVYVVDSARLKEQRYDPEKHMSSLVSAWVGSSNMNQRAGRAGRHRPGEYFGVLSKDHASKLHAYQTVEMMRVDLSNVVMHVKALNFPGMTVEDVLAAAIEPPPADRVAAAMKDLQMVGALDAQKELTSLGRVLLQLPVDVQVGRLVLYGSFFRCLDQALTLAALLTNRDPFVSPMHLKNEASRIKNSWCPPGFKSDALAALQAYNAWDAMQSRGEYISANRFCVDNFLAKPTLLMIQKIKTHILQSLYSAGVIDVSGGGAVANEPTGRHVSIPPELNENGDSFPLLTALIAIATQPKFAVKVSERILRTPQDRVTMIHPSSVNHPKNVTDLQKDTPQIKQIYAYLEKRRNVSSSSGPASTFLVTTTHIDPMTYMLFGAHDMQKNDQGVFCDNWMSVVGHLDALDDVYDLRQFMDGCMLRVFEGIIMGRRHRRQKIPTMQREEESESGFDLDDRKDYSLSVHEVKELDLLSRDMVSILNQASADKQGSRQTSRPATPSLLGPGGVGSGLGLPTFPRIASGYSTPYGNSAVNSRASTPTFGRPHRRF